jgi:predicted RNA binding protein YcfA (HicA-like mRNA interferase family)
MSKPTFKKTSDFEKFVKQNGYTLDHISGSHMIYKGNNKPTLSIPNSREIAPGTCRNLLKLVNEHSDNKG